MLLRETTTHVPQRRRDDDRVTTTPSFWSRFKANYWEQEGASQLPAHELMVPFRARELFDATVSALEPVARGVVSNPRPRFIVNGRRMDLDASAMKFLPTRSDGSFTSFNERIMSARGMSTFAIVINHLFEHDERLWTKLCERMQPFFREIGVPFHSIETFLFLGNYDKTPFGIHVDNAATFHFPIHGRKHIRLWKPESIAAHPHLRNAREYADHCAESEVVHADPGYALYWPSDRWHIAEGDGSFKVSWGFAYYIGNGVHRATHEIFRKQMIRARPAPCASVPIGDTRPERILDEAREYRVTVDGEAREIASQKWLEHVSAFGFNPLFTPKPPSGRTLRANATFPVYSRREGKKIVVACAGRSFIAEASEELTRLLAELEAGKSVPMPKPGSRSVRDALIAKLAEIIPQTSKKGSTRG